MAGGGYDWSPDLKIVLWVYPLVGRRGKRLRKVSHVFDCLRIELRLSPNVTSSFSNINLLKLSYVRVLPWCRITLSIFCSRGGLREGQVDLGFCSREARPTWLSVNAAKYRR